MNKILISSIWDAKRIPDVINRLKVDKVYFIVEHPVFPDRQLAIDRIKAIFGGKKEFLFLAIKTYNILDIVHEVLEVIRTEYANNNQIYINISEGMKQMAMGSMFAAYIEKNKVQGIYYINPATGELLRYPFLDFNVRNGKKEVLKSINELCLDKKESLSIKEIETKSGLGTTSVYEYIKELKRDGFIDKNNLITDFGRVVLLKK